MNKPLKKIHLICAARPNFMKIAPLYHALKSEKWAKPIVVHTGQHYDSNMSAEFFHDLGLPQPELFLNVGSGTHAEQTGRVMIAYEAEIMRERPDFVVVVGDVNSTMAAALSAVKLGVKVGHLEAGLRSFDRTMPEEINRLVTDALCDILWTPSPDADQNLIKEGVPPGKIQRVGNIMIDSLEMLRPRIECDQIRKNLNLNGKFGVVTLHRPCNVDSAENLEAICKTLVKAASKCPLVFPMHPRTEKSLLLHGLRPIIENREGLHVIRPLSYIPFMNLVFNSRLVITDSGGLQEETTYLGIQCLTLRPNTERPVTITQGTNRLCRFKDLDEKIDHILSSGHTNRKVPELWDGRTAARVVKSIKSFLNV